LTEYIGKSICLRTQGFADTCFYLKNGLSKIYLNLNNRILEPIAITSINDSRTKFRNTLDSFLSHVRKQDMVLLEYKINMIVAEKTKYNYQNISSTIFVEQPAFRAFSPFLTFHFDSLQFTRENDKSSKSELDSLNILPLLYSTLNESFWVGNKEIRLLKQRHTSIDSTSHVIQHPKDSLETFLTNYYQFLNNQKLTFGAFKLSFDKENRLVEYCSYDSTFINPFAKNGPSRKLKNLQINYSKIGLHYPCRIATTIIFFDQPEYEITINMTLQKVSPTYIPNHQKVLPMFNWKMSTLAWLRYHGIAVGD
jgi:hypothetical protein